MKKLLAIFLSVLLVCIAVAPMAMAVTNPGITTKVYEGAYNKDAANVDYITDTTFTVAVSVPAVQKLTGVSLYFTFDPSVLTVVDADLAGSDDGDGYTPFFSGVGVDGYKHESNDEYSFGWISSNGVTKNGARDMFYITFAVLDATATETSFNLYVNEFRTDDGDDENDITATFLVDSKVLLFNLPEDATVATTEDATEDVTAPDEDSTTSTDINELLQLIRDMLNGNNVTFGDFADAIANVLGNAEITDMIEQLVDGNIDISDAFQEFLAGLGLDFGSLEDLLNKIIDFLLGLFGGGDSGDDASTTAVATTAAASTTAPNLETTASGSANGSEETGDTGVALAATVCVAATAAFVLTKKKKETV